MLRDAIELKCSSEMRGAWRGGRVSLPVNYHSVARREARLSELADRRELKEKGRAGCEHRVGR